MSNEVLIALFGFVATVSVAVVSQVMQAKRETRRQNFDAQERSMDRLYAHRKDAYANFISLFDSKYASYFEHGFTDEFVIDDDWLHPVWDRLTDVRIYGSPRGYKHARDALVNLASWVFGGVPPEGVELADSKAATEYFEKSAHESFEFLLTQARSDLGADRLGETPAE